MNWKIILLAIVILIILAVATILFVEYFLYRNEVLSPGVTEQQNIPAANGNVNDTVKAIESSLNNEESGLSQENNEAASVNSEINALNDFGQSYNDKEF